MIWSIDDNDVLRTKTLSFVTALVVKCAARIVATCSDYKVNLNDRSKSLIEDESEATDYFLNVHCGLSAGELILLNCGKKASASPVRNTLDSNNKSTVLPNRRNFKEENRVEFFAIGKCIEQASVALDFSKRGKVYASSSIINLFHN